MKRIITLVMALILCFNFTGGVSASAKKKQQENYTIKYKIPSYLTKKGITNPNPNSYSVKAGLVLKGLNIPQEYQNATKEHIYFNGWYYKDKRYNQILPGTTGNIELIARYSIDNDHRLSVPYDVKLIKKKNKLYVSFMFTPGHGTSSVDQVMIYYYTKDSITEQHKVVKVKNIDVGIKKRELPLNTTKVFLKTMHISKNYRSQSCSSEILTI